MSIVLNDLETAYDHGGQLWALVTLSALLILVKHISKAFRQYLKRPIELKA
jgi:hypothetical protein